MPHSSDVLYCSVLVILGSVMCKNNIGTVLDPVLILKETVNHIASNCIVVYAMQINPD